MSRKLLTRALENTGLDQRFWMMVETGGFGDAATNSPGIPNTGSQACAHMTGAVEFNIPRSDASFRSGRSVVTRLSGKKDVKWNMETYIIPGAPDMSNHPTLPDAHPMLLTAFGTVNQSSPTQIVYSMAANTSSSFRLLEEGTHFSRQAVGCVADTATFTLPGDGKAMMKFDGFAQDVYFAAQSTLSTGMTGVNVAPVATGTGGRYQVNAWVDIIDQTDGITSKTTTPRQITAISGDNLTLSGSAITAASGDFIIGYAPTYTPQDPANALLGLKGSFTTTALGTVDCQLVKAEITIKNSYTPKTQFYGKSKICGYVPDKKRAVTIKMDVLLTRDNFEFYSNNTTFLADDLTIVLQPQDIPAPLNSTTGRTFTFVLPRVEFNVPKLEMKDSGYVTLSLEGTALATDVNTTETEMTLTIS